MFSKEYIAGQNLDEAIVNAKKLNEEGIKPPLTFLVNLLLHWKKQKPTRNEYLQVIEEAEKAGVEWKLFPETHFLRISSG